MMDGFSREDVEEGLPEAGYGRRCMIPSSIM